MATKTKETEQHKYSRPWVEIMLATETEQMNRLGKRDHAISRTLNNLYLLDVIMYFISDDDIADKANDKANAALNELNQYINKLDKKLKAQVEEYQSEDDHLEIVNHTVREVNTYKAYCPLAKRFLRTMSRSENMFRLINTAWLEAEVISRKECRNFTRGLDSLVRVTINQIKNTAYHAQVMAKSNETANKKVTQAMKYLNIEAVEEADLVVSEDDVTSEANAVMESTTEDIIAEKDKISNSVEEPQTQSA